MSIKSSTVDGKRSKSDWAESDERMLFVVGTRNKLGESMRFSSLLKGMHRERHKLLR